VRRNLFNYLEKLNEQDLVQIEHYLKSPFFTVTNRNRVIALFKYLKRYHPNYHNNIRTGEEAIIRKLNFQNVANLRTNLLDAVSDYLQLKSLERHKTIQTFLLADTLDHLKINEFERYTELAIEKIDAKAAKNATAYFLKYHLLMLLHMSRGAKRVGDNNTFLKEAINALNNYFVFDSLKLLNAYKTNEEYNLNANFFDELNKILKKYIEHCDVNDPNIKIYYLINKGFKVTNIKKQQQQYFKLKKLTMKNWNELAVETQNEVYISLVNKAKVLKNNCCTNFEQELFSLRQFGIEQGIHLIYNEIDSSMFYNIVCSACDVEAFEWCENFIEENQQYLSEREQSDILLISYAYFNLKRQKYDDALENLLLAESLNTILNTSFKVVARIIELKCMYYINDYDRFDACYRRFLRFLNNQNDLHENTVKRIKIFIQLTLKLFKGKNKYDLNTSLKEIEELIKTEDNLYDKPWLLKQLLRLKSE